MRAANPAVVALLNSSRFHIADVYTITLANGTVLRWSAMDRAIAYGSDVWVLGPLIDRGTTRLVRGVEVGTLTLTIRPRAVDTLLGMPLAHFIARGGFDGARVLLQRAYAADARAPIVGLVDWFLGLAGAAEGGRSGFTLPVNSYLIKLNTKMPRQVYQPSCGRQLYDAGCGVLRATYTTAGAITDGAAGRLAFDTNLAAAGNYYDQGVLTFTAGANAGVSRTVKSHSAGGGLVLLYPLPVAPGNGDAFEIYPGCDKTRGAGGCARFSNEARFRGFEYVPAAETAF